MACNRSIRCVALVVLLAQGAAFAAPKPLETSELKKALSFYQSIAKLDVDFKQTKTLKDIQLELKSEGHLSMSLPDHVQWKVTKPEPMTVDLEQQKITIHSASNTQTFKQSENPSAKDRKNFESLLSWLKLDADAITAQYDALKLADREYRFTAKDPQSMLKSLEMKLTADGHVRALDFEEASGDRIHLEFGRPHVVKRSQ